MRATHCYKNEKSVAKNSSRFNVNFYFCFFEIKTYMSRFYVNERFIYKVLHFLYIYKSEAILFEILKKITKILFFSIFYV